MLGVMIRSSLAVFLLIGANLSSRADPPDLAAGSEAVQQGRWDEAIGLFSQAIAQPGRSKAELGSAHSQRGYAYFARGLVDPAIADYNAAIKLAPEDGHAYALRGWAHFIKGGMKQAIADSTAAIRLDPTAAFAFRNRARAELYSGKAKNAADDFAAAARLAPTDTLGVIWLHVARVRAGDNDLDEFRRNIERIDRKEWPGPLVEPLTGAMTPERVGDIAMSAKGEKSQLERRCDAQVYFGLLQTAAGDRTEAGKLFRAALEDCPTGVAEATEIAVAKLELKGVAGVPASTPRGSSGASSGASPGADVAGDHHERGYAYFGRGQVDQAIAEYNSAVRLAPNDARNYTLRGLAHFTKGAMNQAIADSAAAIRLDSNSAASFRIRGLAQLYAGRPKPAADDFAAAVRLDPSDVLGAIWLHVARTRSGYDDRQEFRANIAKVDHRAWPGPLADVLTGASTAERVGDIAMSASGEKNQLERVCDAQVYLGLLQLAAGDKKEAGKLFKAAVADCPLGAAEAIELTVAKTELKRLGGGSAEAEPKPTVPHRARQAPSPRPGGGSS